jgi:hypothetical protein
MVNPTKPPQHQTSLIVNHLTTLSCEGFWPKCSC